MRGTRLISIPLLMALILALWGCAQINPFGSASGSDARLQNAELALKRKDTVGAEAQFDAYLRKDPNNPVSLLEVALRCQALGAWELASRYADLGLQHGGTADKKVRLLLYNVASTSWYNLGKPDKAVEMAKAGFAVDPHDPDAMNLLGYIYAVIPVPDKLSEALSLTREAVEVAKERDMPADNVAMYLDSVGWAEYQLGATNTSLYPRALADLQRAANLLPGIWEVQYHAGMAAIKLQRYDDAVVALERAARLNPGLPAVEQALKEARSHASAHPPAASNDEQSPPAPVTRSTPYLPGATF